MKQRHNIIGIEIDTDDNNSNIAIYHAPRELDDIQTIGYYVEEDNIAISKPLIDNRGLGYIYLVLGETHPFFNLLSPMSYNESNNHDLNDEYQDSLIEATYQLHVLIQMTLLPSYGIDINSIGKLK